MAGCKERSARRPADPVCTTSVSPCERTEPSGAELSRGHGSQSLCQHRHPAALSNTEADNYRQRTVSLWTSAGKTAFLSNSRRYSHFSSLVAMAKTLHEGPRRTSPLHRSCPALPAGWPVSYRGSATSRPPQCAVSPVSPVSSARCRFGRRRTVPGYIE